MLLSAPAPVTRGGMTHVQQSAETSTRLAPKITTAAGAAARAKLSASPAPPRGVTALTGGSKQPYACTALSAPSGNRTLLPVVGDQHPIAAFLRDNALGQYSELFIKHGFDEMDTLLEIQEADMQALGLPPFVMGKLTTAVRYAREQLHGKLSLSEANFESQNPVAIFLGDAGLPQYRDVLLGSGFDEMETLCEIGDADMKELGIPRGHALKLHRKLREYFSEAEASCAPVAGPSPPTRDVRGEASAHFAPPTEVMKTAVVMSWEIVQGVGTDVVAERLSTNLFALVPQARVLFPSERLTKYRDWMAADITSEAAMDRVAMNKLWGRVVNVVGCSVAGLHNTNQLVPMLRQLGMRHINYGGPEVYWEIAGKALNMTLREFLGDGFTGEVEQAWNMTFSFITAVMVSGLREARETAQMASSAASVASLPDSEPPSIDASLWRSKISDLEDCSGDCTRDSDEAQRANGASEPAEEPQSAMNLSPRIGVADVAQHASESDCWIIIGDDVYDFTNFISKHPGGKQAVLASAGRNGTEDFDMCHDRSVIKRYGLDLGTVVHKGKISK